MYYKCRYKAAVGAHGTAIGAQPELAAGQTSLEQKIAILALMTLIFNRGNYHAVAASSFNFWKFSESEAT